MKLFLIRSCRCAALLVVAASIASLAAAAAEPSVEEGELALGVEGRGRRGGGARRRGLQRGCGNCRRSCRVALRFSTVEQASCYYKQVPFGYRNSSRSYAVRTNRTSSVCRAPPGRKSVLSLWECSPSSCGGVADPVACHDREFKIRSRITGPRGLDVTVEDGSWPITALGDSLAGYSGGIWREGTFQSLELRGGKYQVEITILPGTLRNVTDWKDLYDGVYNFTVRSDVCKAAALEACPPPPTASPAPPPTLRPTVAPLCNGLANLCRASVADAAFATLHNAYASADKGFGVFPNHRRSLESAVMAGYRGINLDVGVCGGRLALVHTYCFLGKRDPVKVLSWLDSWLDANPSEVVLLPTQIDNASGGPVSLEQVWNLLQSSGNIAKKLYVHDPSKGFPTLGELVETNRRVLFFVYGGRQTCASLEGSAGSGVGFRCPPGMYDWFQYAAETEYQFDSVAELRDEAYSCRVTRGSATAPLLGVNVFLSLPNPTASRTLNGADFLRPHLQGCAQRNGRASRRGGGVNAVLVDFWDEGDVLEVVREHNSLL
jgi:hypothetical protein